MRDSSQLQNQAVEFACATFALSVFRREMPEQVGSLDKLAQSVDSVQKKFSAQSLELPSCFEQAATDIEAGSKKGDEWTLADAIVKKSAKAEEAKVSGEIEPSGAAKSPPLAVLITGMKRSGPSPKSTVRTEYASCSWAHWKQ